MNAFIGGCLLMSVAVGSADDPAWRLPADPAALTADRVARQLSDLAAEAQTPLEEFHRRLAAANWMLAHQLAEPTTRWLLEASTDADAARVQRVLAATTVQLDAARRLWADAGETADLTPAQRWRFQETLAGLEAFAQAASVLWAAKADENTSQQEALSAAAVQLAILLEAERVEVADGARLWQAALYVRRGDWQRVLDVSPPTLAAPEDDSVFGFYARLLRCRYSPRVVGGYPAAVALLARLEVRCSAWFTDPAMARRAARTAALFRRALLKAWADEQVAAGAEDSAARCADAVRRLDETYFQGEEPFEVLALPAAIPNLVDLDAAVAALHTPTSPPPSVEKNTTTNGPTHPDPAE